MYIVSHAQLLLVLFIIIIIVNFGHPLLPQYKIKQILYYAFIRSSNGIFVSLFFYNVSVTLKNSSSIHGLLPNTIFLFSRIILLKTTTGRISSSQSPGYLLSLVNSAPSINRARSHRTTKLLIQRIIFQNKNNEYVILSIPL